MRSILVALFVTACASQPQVQVSPADRTEAITLYMNGASSREIGDRLAIGHDAARQVLRKTIFDLSRRFYKDR